MTLSAFLTRHPLLTFLILLLSLVTFGVLSLNIFSLLSANWEYISQYGLMGLRDGGAQQLLELLLNGVVSVLAYLSFKVSEGILVDWIKSLGKGRRSKQD